MSDSGGNTSVDGSVCEKNAKPVGALIFSMRIPLISLLKFVSSGYFSFSLAIVFNFIFSQSHSEGFSADGNGNLFDGFSRSCREEVSHGNLKNKEKVEDCRKNICGRRFLRHMCRRR